MEILERTEDENLHNGEYNKENLIPEAVNMKDTKGIVNVPVPGTDIGLIFKIPYNDGIITVTDNNKNDIAYIKDITEDEMYATALSNIPKANPITLKNYVSALGEFLDKTDKTNGNMDKYPAYLIGTESSRYGFVMALKEDNLSMISNRYKEKGLSGDIILIPSSKDECIVLPLEVKEVEVNALETLQKIHKEIMEERSNPQRRLSENLIYYDAKTKQYSSIQPSFEDKEMNEEEIDDMER